MSRRCIRRGNRRSIKRPTQPGCIDLDSMYIYQNGVSVVSMNNDSLLLNL